MSSTPISTLKRKWIPYARGSELCYLFLDKNGDAIQAIGSLRDETYFDSVITIGTCYRVTKYICETAKQFLKIVPHPTNIRIGKAAEFSQIENDGFPVYFFRFLPYEDLHTLLNRPQELTGPLKNIPLLHFYKLIKFSFHRLITFMPFYSSFTNFIGKVNNVSDLLIRKEKTLLKIQLQTPSNQYIEATLWAEIAKAFNRDSILTQASPVIVAVTSMKVSEYQGNLQLGSTSATHIYINPDIDLTKSISAHFINNNAGLIPVTSHPPGIKEKPSTTLTQLFKKNFNTHAGERFTCTATIVGLNYQRGWFYKCCDKCRKKLLPIGDDFACEDHGLILDLKYV